MLTYADVNALCFIWRRQSISTGPVQDTAGKWHLWEDEGGWSNFTSLDLMHWNGTLKSTTHMNGLTGSVSPTPSGVYAFWLVKETRYPTGVYFNR